MSESTRGRIRVEPGRKRVRATVGGTTIADSVRPLLVWEVPYYPAYYLPAADVRTDLLVPNGRTERSPSRGDGVLHDLRLDGEVRVDAARTHPDSPIEALRDSVRLVWDSMDAWFEEDEPVYVHPRDPYTRVDILDSSRHVRVELDGLVLAESVRPTILFETGLPPRYYLPLTDVRREHLLPSATTSACPYKGTAEYWSVAVGDTVHDDLVWTYRAPLPESQKVAGLVCFYDERVDVTVDGVPQDRPRTKFA